MNRLFLFCLVIISMLYSCKDKDKNDEVSDISGKMYVKSIRVGAVNLAEFTYDVNYNTTSIITNSVENGLVVKSGEIIRITNNIPSAFAVKTYATQKEKRFETNYYDINNDGISDYDVDTIITTDKGAVFYKLNPGDTTYRLYTDRYQLSSTQWRYSTYPHAVKKTSINSSIVTYDYWAKFNSTTAYYFSRVTQTSEYVGSNYIYTYWYAIMGKSIYKGEYNVGDLKENEKLLKLNATHWAKWRNCTASTSPATTAAAPAIRPSSMRLRSVAQTRAGGKK